MLLTGAEGTSDPVSGTDDGDWRSGEMLAHVPISLGMLLAFWRIGLLLGAPAHASVWLGVIAGAAVCVMREITQREYQWIQQFGHGHRAEMPGYEGLKFWEWNAHSLSETAVAIIAVIVLALIIER